MAFSLEPALVARLHDRAQAGRWGVSVDRFGDVLAVSLAHAMAAGAPGARDIETYLTSLRLEDLAMATACADGHEAAWDHFIREIRPILYRAADALDRSGGARELADGLYGDLYGVRESGGARQSLFRYFHGRSSLATWVRAVLSQRFVDRARASRRTDELPDDDSASALTAPAGTADAERQNWLSMVHAALAAAIASLVARDRLALGLYYAQSMKLAAIGRVFKESEATVSRRLTRVRREIRDAVERRLRDEHGLSPSAVAECLAAAADDAGALDLGQMLAGDEPRKESELVRSTDGGGRRVERA
jgi:RNA polymerase sigma factor (sigma-70 family)